MEKAYYWPIWLNNSLSIKTKNVAKLENICQGQLYLWRALNLYDNIMDDDNGSKDLPQANNYYRNYLKILYQLPLPEHFFAEAEKIFITQEKANEDEIKRSKKDMESLISEEMPDYLKLDKLSQKSLPLSLLPIASYILYKKESQEINLEKIITFFKYLLATKQMADDALDFKTDIRQNKITRANYHILREAKSKGLDYMKTKNLNLLFILESQKIAQDILHLSKLTIDSGKNIGINENAPIINNIIGKAINRAKKSIALKKML